MGGDAGMLDAIIRNAVVQATAELTAENAGLRAECERLRAKIAAHPADDPELDATDGAHPAWWRGYRSMSKAVVDLARDLDEARAIIEGRTTPPTDEEIAAHEAAGGTWRTIVPDEWIFTDDLISAIDARSMRDVQIANAKIVKDTARWWALDCNRRPCAWPEVVR